MNTTEKHKEYQKEYKIKNKLLMVEKSKEYYKENKSLILKTSKEYYEKNKLLILKKSKEKYQENKLLIHKENYEENKLLIREYQKKHYEKNKLLIQKKIKKYFEKNKLLIHKKRNIYLKKRREEDISFRILGNTRKRILTALKSNSKSSKTIDLLGCDIAFLKQYLESKFKDGMCWENYGLKGWHIDHIKPCYLFDFKNIEEQKQCFHYTNLQPLSAIDNLIKGKKWENIL